MTQSGPFFIDRFDDGTFKDRWEYIQKEQSNDNQITESGETLQHNAAANYDSNSPIRTQETFEASGTHRIEARIRSLTSDYNGYGFALRAPEWGVAVKEHKWSGFDRFAVFGVKDRPDKYNSDYDAYGKQENKAKLASATSRTTTLTYGLTIDFDSNTVQQIRREGETWDVSFPVGDPGGPYHLSLPAGGGHKVEYDAMAAGPADGDWTLRNGTDVGTATPTQTQSPTQTPSPTPTPSPTETPSPTPTQSPDEVTYDIEGASLFRDVRLGENQYRVVWDIPDADSQRRAVLSMNGNLVSQRVASDVLITDAWAGSSQKFDYSQELERAREARNGWQTLQDLNRFADLSVTVAAAVGLASSGGVTAAIGPALEALNDGVSWATDEVDDPYKEQFAKISETAATARWADQSLGGLVSLGEVGQEAVSWIKLATEGYNTAKDLSDVASVASTVGRVAIDTRSLKTGIMAGGTAAQAIAPQMITGLLVSKSVKGITRPFELNARTAALGAAHTTVRIPLLEQLKEMQEQALSGTLAPPEIVRYKTYEHANYAIKSAGYAGQQRHQAAIDDTFLGQGYAALFNSDQIAHLAEQNAERFADLSKYTIAELGAGLQEAETRFARSINNEVFTQRS